MTKIIVPFHEILDGTPLGLVWKGGKLLFKDCARHWIAAHRAEHNPNLPDDPKNLCVAWRDYFARPRYFEFPTSHDARVRIVFTKPERRFWRFRGRTNERDFAWLKKYIEDSAWMTYDLG